MLDPQQRLMLECAWEVASPQPVSGTIGTNSSVPAAAGARMGPTRSGGHPAGPPVPPDTGVYMGASYSEWAAMLSAHGQAASTYTASGGGLSVIPGRISFALGLAGPSMLTDTACSSSLVALASAHSALMLGACRSAISGGVNLMLSPGTSSMYAAAGEWGRGRAAPEALRLVGYPPHPSELSSVSPPTSASSGMLTPDGRCKTLDAAADGYVRAEAAAALMLRSADSLTAALGGPDASAGTAMLLLGSAVNQDGRSSSLTAPNGPAQSALIRAALTSSQLPAIKVGLLQMHGTGTALGDPIEVNAALSVLMARRAGSDGPLTLAASKAAAGHAEPAAGAVGLAAAVMAAEARGAPALPHLRGVNPHVQQCLGSAGKMACGRAGVYAPRQLAALPSARSHGRVAAGTSAFAFQVRGGRQALFTY